MTPVSLGLIMLATLAGLLFFNTALAVKLTPVLQPLRFNQSIYLFLRRLNANGVSNSNSHDKLPPTDELSASGCTGE